MAAVTVVVVDDQITFLHAMATVVEETPGFCVVGRPARARSRSWWTDALRPHLVLMDVNLPGIDGVEATRRLRRTTPTTVVVLLSTYDEDAGERVRQRVRRGGVRHQVGVRTGSAARGLGSCGAPRRMSGSQASSATRPSSMCIDTVPPVASTRSRMWLSGSAPSSRPVTTTRSRSSSTDKGTTTGPPMSRTASATQKYAAASTRGSKRRPLAESSTARRWVPASAREQGAEGGRKAGSGELGREHAAGDLAERLERAVERSDERVEVRGGRRRLPRPARWRARRRRSARGCRCGTTCRAMARSSRRRSASPALMRRTPGVAQLRFRWLSCSTWPDSSTVSRALRKASPAWSARSARRPMLARRSG